MADVTIGGLPPGGPVQAGDLVEVQRPGSPDESLQVELGDAAGKDVGSGAGDVAAGNHTHAVAVANVSDGLISKEDQAKLDAIQALADVTDAESVADAGALMAANNLSDLGNAATARTALGLGAAATRGIGTTGADAAAGNDSRITGAAQKSANLSDLADVLTARVNLKIVVIEESAYEALSPPDGSTIYFVIEDA